MAKDPYKLLGVPKTASEADIKKAYRGLAKKFHPDANPGDDAAAERFKEISAAYTLLTDKDLRARFDSGEVDASGQQQNPFGGGGFDPRRYQNRQFDGVGNFDDMSDLFSSLFGMQMGGMSGMGRGGMNMGGMNTGGMNSGGARASTMGGARGGGFNRPQKGADVRYRLTLSFMDALAGGVKRIRMANGANLDVTIPKGVEDGQTLRLRGKGQSGVNGGPAGDARVTISVKSHKFFSRDGDNLRMTLPITLKEAVSGGQVRIALPTGDLSLKIPAGTNSGKTFRLKGKGIKGGDLYATTQIVLEDPTDPGLVIWAGSAKDESAPTIRTKLI